MPGQISWVLSAVLAYARVKVRAGGSYRLLLIAAPAEVPTQRAVN